MIALIAGLALAAAGCGGSGEGSASAPAETPTEVAPAAAGGCQTVTQPAAKDVGSIAKPKARLSAAKTYVATVATSCGDFEITLDAKRSPITGGSFKYLADKGFFDGTSFHRIVADFVIQGGDPQGDGSGGPGYTVVEAPPKDLAYTPGVVAMAKTASEPAGASGSQFFVVTGASASTLTPDYALLGKVTKGMDVVDRIGAIQADPNSGQPATPVEITSIKVSATP